MKGAVSHINNHIEKWGGENEVAKVSMILNISKEVQNNAFNGNASR